MDNEIIKYNVQKISDSIQEIKNDIYLFKWFFVGWFFIEVLCLLAILSKL